MSKPKFRTPEQVWDLWIDTLESGKYKQAHSQLKKMNSFCCLGVLCDLATKDGSEFYWCENNFTDDVVEEDCFLPTKFANYLGLSQGDVEDISALNDISDCSFPEIAAYLEVLKPICLDGLSK
jgi:hypothetical protein